MTESEKDFLRFVGYDEETIAGAAKLLDDTTYQAPGWYFREGRRQEPAAVFCERMRGGF